MLHTFKQLSPGQSDVRPAKSGRPGGKEFVVPLHSQAAVDTPITYDEPAELVRARLAIPPTEYTVLVVDDHDFSRDAVARSLVLDGHTVVTANNGRQALTLLKARSFDLVLLDIMMPEVNGFQVLEQCRADSQLQHIPIVVMSGSEDVESVVHCVEMGAADYLLKPFDHVLFKARVDSCLEKKRLRDQEQAYIRQLKAEQEKSERLLLSILPAPIAARLKHSQDSIAEQFDDVTVLFADIVDFTALATRLTPTELVGVLNQIFCLFDQLAEQHGLEKIKTIGDAYMVVGGLPVARADHAEAIADMALEMRRAIACFNDEHGELFTMRIGISSGPAVAGVIGTTKFAYDLWGDTVNTASRMESHGLPGHIQVSAATYKRLRKTYSFTARGWIDVKGKGAMRTYLLERKKAPRRSNRGLKIEDRR
jgi:class 3 adenylate cyclase